MFLFTAAVPQKVSERTPCHSATPSLPGWASSDPTLRRSDSPPLSSAEEFKVGPGSGEVLKWRRGLEGDKGRGRKQWNTNKQSNSG